MADDPTWIRRDFIAAYDGAVQDAITPATIASLRDGSATLKGLPTNATPEHQGPLQRESENYVDTGDRSELIAHNLEVDHIREYLNADSLSYLALDRLITATGAPGAGFCDACFTGRYPVEVPLTLRKHVLEDNSMPTAEAIVQQALDGTTA